MRINLSLVGAWFWLWGVPVELHTHNIIEVLLRHMNNCVILRKIRGKVLNINANYVIFTILS